MANKSIKETSKKLKLFLSVVMKEVPFVPNLERIKNIIDVKDARTIKEYLIKLEEAWIVKLLMT